jgi:cytochrome b561
MSDQIRPPAYSPISKWIHWITALCVLGIIPGGILMTNMDEGPLQNQLYDMHRSFGVVVFVLALARVTARRMFGTPAPLETLTPLERRASVAVHHSLMALIILMPLIGWLMTSAYRVDVSVFGLFTLPHLMPKSEPIFDALAAAHKWLGLLMAALILSHIGAAIMHTFIKRDGVLQRMLPASGD